MIEVKNLKINNNMIDFDYKVSFNNNYKHAKYDIKQDELIDIEDDISDVEINCIFHAITRIKKQIKENNIKEEFKEIWY